jgi:hypothetical protein
MDTHEFTTSNHPHVQRFECYGHHIVPTGNLTVSRYSHHRNLILRRPNSPPCSLIFLTPCKLADNVVSCPMLSPLLGTSEGSFSGKVRSGKHTLRKSDPRFAHTYSRYLDRRRSPTIPRHRFLNVLFPYRIPDYSLHKDTAFRMPRNAVRLRSSIVIFPADH